MPLSRPAALGRKEIGMNEGTGAGRRAPSGPGRAGAVAALAAVTLLAGACGGGGSHPAGAGANSAQPIVETLNAYAQCMRSHGEPEFHFVRVKSGPPPSLSGGPELIDHGWASQGVGPSLAQFQSASQACQHLFPATPPSAGELHQQFLKGLQTAKCMRADGYPDWPDPQQSDGTNLQTVPIGIDTISPQFQAAAKKCGVSLPPGG
jgi:hypothetical protein